nr:hypothetical protein StreXyl84_41830 [Streptomyces sp. Xyl84]
MGPDRLHQPERPLHGGDQCGAFLRSHTSTVRVTDALGKRTPGRPRAEGEPVTDRETGGRACPGRPYDHGQGPAGTRHPERAAARWSPPAPGGPAVRWSPPGPDRPGPGSDHRRIRTAPRQIRCHRAGTFGGSQPGYAV